MSNQRKRSISKERDAKQQKGRSVSRERDIRGKNNNATDRSKEVNFDQEDDNSSEVTIYRPALKRATEPDSDNPVKSQHIKDRLSSSSEEGDFKGKRTSPGGDSELIDDLIVRFLGTQRTEGLKRDRFKDRTVEPVAHCSKDDTSAEDYRLEMERRIQDRAEQIVRDAEHAKANIYEVPGRKSLLNNFSKSLVYSMLLDDDYQAVEVHIDQNTILKILNGEYVDFAKLLPHERTDGDSEEKLELVSRGGNIGFVPLSEREKKCISSIMSWNTAFRVFSKIYTERYPERGTELVEYSHNIHLLAETFVWNNVYRYDREFRYHMEKHPERNWGMVLQRAWTLYLRDKIQFNTGTDQRQLKSFDNNSQKGVSSKKVNKICYKYNGGKCTYGFNCKFQHKCGVCNKFGHGAHICRKANSMDSRNNSNIKVEHEDSDNTRRNARASRK